MTEETARAMLGTSAGTGTAGLRQAYERQKVSLEESLQRAPTPSLQAKYRQRLAELNEAFTLLADGSGGGAAEAAPDNLPRLHKVVENAGPPPSDGRHGWPTGQPSPDAPGASVMPRGASAGSSWKWVAGALAAVVVLLAAFVVGMFISRPPERREREQTVDVQAKAAEQQRQEQQRQAAVARSEQEEESRRRLAAVEKARQEEQARQAASKAEQEEWARQAKLARDAAEAAKAKGPKVLKVPDDYTTIQAAINAASAGDTVLVGPGIYTESLDIHSKDNIELRGTDRDRVIVRHDGKGYCCLWIKDCTSGRISSMTFEHTGSDNGKSRNSVVFLDSSNVEMRDCLMQHGCGHGIYISGRSRTGTGPTISACTITNCGWNGIGVAEKNSEARLENNTCRSNKQNGISYWNGARGTAEANTCVENVWCGISLGDESTKVQLASNVCSDNQHHGISIEHGADGTIMNNTCERNGWNGISVFNKGTNSTISGNRSANNRQWGILKWDGAQPHITRDNVVTGNKSGQIGP